MAAVEQNPVFFRAVDNYTFIHITLFRLGELYFLEWQKHKFRGGSMEQVSEGKTEMGMTEVYACIALSKNK